MVLTTYTNPTGPSQSIDYLSEYSGTRSMECRTILIRAPKCGFSSIFSTCSTVILYEIRIQDIHPFYNPLSPKTVFIRGSGLHGVYVNDYGWASTTRRFFINDFVNITEYLQIKHAGILIARRLVTWWRTRRDSAARKIQFHLRRWLFEPVTRDGKLGIQVRLMFRDAIDMQFITC